MNSKLLLSILTILFSSRVANSQQIEKDVDILILGAGAAGLGAARTIQADNPNLSFLIIEASPKVGGRIRSTNMKNTDPNDTIIQISAGAQWLHAKDNPLYEYAFAKGLTIDDGLGEGAGRYIREDKFEADPGLITVVNQTVADIIKDVEKFAYNPSIPYPPSFNVFLTSEFEKKIMLWAPETQVIARQILDWHKRFHLNDNAALDFDNISAKEWGSFHYLGGKWEHISLKNGFAEVMELMAGELRPNTIKFNKRVMNVDYRSSLDKILVRCEDNTYYSANHVIITFSLGVLKEFHKGMFNPQLPPKHVEAINCLGFGSAGKVVLQFHDSWWKNEDGLQFLYHKHNWNVSHLMFSR